MEHFSPGPIIQELSRNQEIFSKLLAEPGEDILRWRPAPEKWCLLEILCHLYDEEREDFRTRLASVLQDPKAPFPPIDPVGWVTARNYIEQDYNDKLHAFLQERTNSINWLKSLSSPRWDNTYQHPTIGPMSGAMILSNWLAHDYLHIRQITRQKYAYLKQQAGQNLGYAGTW